MEADDPWKYGFKSVKSIVSICVFRKAFLKYRNLLAPHEYGFYANVNPDVAHPRWSQASSEDCLVSCSIPIEGQPCLLMDMYEVASLYSGMDLASTIRLDLLSLAASASSTVISAFSLALFSILFRVY